MEISWEPVELDEFSEIRFVVRVARNPVFVLGFSRLALMSNVVYVTMLPLPGLRTLSRKALAELKRTFDDQRGWVFFCQVSKADKVAARWAEFFGFCRATDELPMRWTYKKDTV